MSGHVIIARTTSRHGGRCQLCGRTIFSGEVVVKIDSGARGATTSGGNGLGRWICTDCADAVD
jgi:hypothetical protein